MASTPQSRAVDAWFMGKERYSRPMTPTEAQKARTAQSVARWRDAESFLGERQAFLLPAGNVCPFAVEGAGWVRRPTPQVGDATAFLSAPVEYRNERLDRLGLGEFKTESWS